MYLTILDTETTGLDPKTDKVIEIAAALYDTSSRKILAQFSTLLPAEGNPAEHINNIPPALLALDVVRVADVTPVIEWALISRAIVAHNAGFDRAFFDAMLASDRFLPLMQKMGLSRIDTPWVDSVEFIDFPADQKTGQRGSRKLVHIAADNGLPVLGAHRAMTDVDTLCRLLDLIPDLDRQIESALLPRRLFRAETTYEQRDLPKSQGFRWTPETKSWTKNLTDDEAASLPFPVKLAQ